MKVVWSRRAAAHLVAIQEHIEHDSQDAARRVAERILECVDRLQEQPLMGRPGRVRGTRELVIAGTPYIAPYRVKGDVMEMIAVFHGRQKWPRRL